MLEIPAELIVPFAIAAIGTAVAGLWDLFTTEVPDELSILMIISSIFYWIVYSIVSNNFIPLIASILLGTIILGIGWLLYTRGKWGGADALILAAVFYALPIYPITTAFTETTPLFFFNYIINLIVISLGYMILYTIVLGIKKPKLFHQFIKDVKQTWKMIISIPVIITAGIMLAINMNTGIVVMPWEMILLLFALMLFWRYAVVIETKYFIRTIPVSKLKKGDVLKEKDKWIGITQAELRKLRKNNKTIKIKEGVRFTPVFFITLIITFLFGNILIYFLT